jgi:HEAT repeat protein
MATTKPDVASLVEQMPETDKELQAKQRPEPENADQQRRAARADRYGTASKFTGPAPEVADKIFAEILEGGRASLLELLALVREPGDADFKNYKAAYVLHGLAIYVGRSGKERDRRLLSDTLASALDSAAHSKGVKARVIRELQACGGKEVVRALGQQLQDEDLCEPATQALLSIREGAAAELRRALPTAQGRNRVTVVQALGVLQDAASAADLRKFLSDPDRDPRLAAAWSLANLSDAASADALLKAADTAEGWERTQTTKACLLLAEKLVVAGKKTEALRLYTHLADTGERYVREAAEQGRAVVQ